MDIRTQLRRVIGFSSICVFSLYLASCGGDDGVSDPGRGGGNGSSSTYDPPKIAQSETTGSMHYARNQHEAILLVDGRVLVTGGYNGSFRTKRCEIYNPEKKAWKETDFMWESRTNHTMTILDDGQVYVTGGSRLNGASSPWFEKFDPTTELWSAVVDRGTTATAMDVGRSSHCATLLPDGRVLITGGYNSKYDRYERTYEFYDPATHMSAMPDKPEPWMARARYCHTATLLNDGRVLVAGGFNNEDRYFPYCEIYDPATDTWSDADPMRTGRSFHTACLLGDGRVLVAGGNATSTVFTLTCEVYDPVADSWSDIGIMKEHRYRHAMVQLSGTRVLVAGNRFSKTTEMCTMSGASGSWVFRDDMFEYRHLQTMTAFSNGVVLIAGGVHLPTGEKYLSSCELFLP
jgi:hypothetical protein